MSYPTSPFPNSFNSKLVTHLLGDISNTTIPNEELQKICKWLCSFPKITTYRVNTLKCKVLDVEQIVRKYCHDTFGCDFVNINIHPLLKNVIIVHSREIRDLIKYEKEIIIDVDCAAAVLRGAHIYAPGVKGMMSGSKIGEKVSIFADTSNKCRRGLQKRSEEEKLFIGNGLVKMQRHQLFAENHNISGIAVEIIDTISGCPPIGDNILPPGWALLQNLPSILCVLALKPQSGETIIDLCASPGNKTTHIAELMENKGILVAIDKTPKKVAQLKTRCDQFGAEAYCFQADSTKIVAADPALATAVTDGPPFLSGSFDRVLLDAPCSVMGKRPQIVNKLRENEIRSYVPLQRKLFEAAVKLLKVNGTLVYSTCTITLSENEGIVAWALKKFECLELVAPDSSLAGPGWIGTSLTEDQRAKVQRFGPDQSVDSVGFFFACFVKTY